MGRKKLPISKIPVAKNRAVTFNKRKMGLMKKAMELSVLCGVDIGLVIFNNGKLHEYSNTDASDVFNTYAEWEGEHDVLDNNDVSSTCLGYICACICACICGASMSSCDIRWSYLPLSSPPVSV
jgi:hypothetical protein